jgi:hypothetical protein
MAEPMATISANKGVKLDLDSLKLQMLPDRWTGNGKANEASQIWRLIRLALDAAVLRSFV